MNKLHQTFASVLKQYVAEHVVIKKGAHLRDSGQLECLWPDVMFGIGERHEFSVADIEQLEICKYGLVIVLKR